MEYSYGYQHRDLKKVVFQNTASIIVGRLANLPLSLIASVIFVRYLGSHKLGQYSSLYAYLTIFNWLTTLGMEQILVREAAKQKDKAGQLFSMATVLSCFLSIGATILAVLVSIAFGYAKGLQTLLLIAAIDLILLSPLRLPGYVFQVNLKQWYSVAIAVIRQALWLMVVIILVLAKAQLAQIILGHLFCSFLEALAVFLCARKFISLRWEWDSAVMANILKHSWPIAVSAFAGAIYSRIDQVLLHSLSGDQNLGYYVAAVNIAEFFGVFAIAFTATMFPLISEASQEKERFEYYIKICFRYLMSFVFGVCAFITVASPSIVRILYGKEYILSSLALSVLIWSEAGIFLGQIMVYAAIAKELQKFVPISTIIAALINIALNIILIPRWGPVGAAWATVVSYNLGGFFLFLIFPATRYLGLMGVKLSYKPLLIGLFCVIFFGSTRQLFVVFLVPILYLIGLFALNIWNKNDLRIISDILSKPKKEPTFG